MSNFEFDVSFDFFKLPCPDIPDDGCSICGPDKCVTSSETTFSYPSQPSIQCGLLEKAGHGGVIPLDQCKVLPDLVKNKCGCQNGIPMSTPALATRKPTRAPTKAPTRSPTRAPTQRNTTPNPTRATSNSSFIPSPCPDIPNGGCSVCGPGKCVTAEERIFSYPGQPEVQCGMLEKAGHTGIVPQNQCRILSELIKDGCDCKSSIPAAVTTTATPPAPAPPTSNPTRAPVLKPTREPTRAPAPTGPVSCPNFMEDDGCSVCGPGKCITDENAVFSYPGQPAISCKLLEEAGRSGIVPLAGCQVLPQLVQDICKCKADAEQDSSTTTTRAPTRAPTRPEQPKPTSTQLIMDECRTIMEDDGCSICGPKSCAAVNCGLVKREITRRGILAEDTCDKFPKLLKEDCSCLIDPEETNAPKTTRAPTRAPTRLPTRPPTRAPTRPPTNAPIISFTREPTMNPTIDYKAVFGIVTNPPINTPIRAELFAGPKSDNSNDAVLTILTIFVCLLGIGSVVFALYLLQKKNSRKIKNASSLGFILEEDGSSMAKYNREKRLSVVMREVLEEDPDLF